jgi:hypothetical protein
MGVAASAPRKKMFAEMEADHAADNALVASGTGGTAILHLTPTQSCSLHGWANPKRTLAWEDVVRNPKITLRKCIDEGLTLQELHEMQPDLDSWISRRVQYIPVHTQTQSSVYQANPCPENMHIDCHV